MSTESAAPLQSLASRLSAGGPVITAELNPPKGVDLSQTLAVARSLRGLAAAFNVTDSQSAVMVQAGLALAHHLVEEGLEPVLQVSCRDRNRIALQADLLAAASLGVRNVLCLTGDDPRRGDNPEARAVFDLDTIGLLRAASALRGGKDLAGNALKGAPDLLAGAVVNPGAPDLEKELRRMDEKIAAGAAFFQTQAVFDLGLLEKFRRRVEGAGVPVLIGVIIPKSAKMARWMVQNLPGVLVPDAVMEELERAARPAEAGVAIAARITAEAVAGFRGAHLMALGWERRIPEVLDAAGIRMSEPPPTRDVTQHAHNRR
ncbi:MAG: 5,10-methylenetetrahydrofolate reductase [SAR202 cluster bacterium]|nr:5,10-methylenetetrahydrofolate reductase [SAR202 cluster bacterium]